MNPELPRFDKARVLVVGDVMLDRYWHGGTSRISPEAPVPVVKVSGIEDSPGGAANVALNLAALGAAASVAGLIGDDENGRILKERLEAAGVLCSFQVSAQQPTVTKLRIISRHQQLLRLDFEEHFSTEESVLLAQRASTHFTNNDVLVVSDYSKGSLLEVQQVIQSARQQGMTVLVDPKGEDFSAYRGATLIKPNLYEFEAIVGKCSTEEQLVTRGQALLDELELEALLVTRGEHGMSLIRRNKPEVHFPARAREVYDVTGAGDTVISTLTAAMLGGSSYKEAATIANYAAGIVCEEVGIVPIDLDKLFRACLG